jgi:calcineurin-like phosphoesterase family protein
MTIWYTADTHFYHGNILKYANRPFQTWWEMNDKIVENWNNKVKSDDEVYHLGDVAFGNDEQIKSILNKLAGKIYLIKGNHDKGHINKIKYRFEWIKDYFELKIKDVEIGFEQWLIMSHYPFYQWNGKHYGSIMLHGHVHSKSNIFKEPCLVDVGVDANNFSPINFEDIKKIVTGRLTNQGI